MNDMKGGLRGMAKKISKPGVYKGLTYSEYDAIDAIRSTYLKKHLHSPASTQVPDEQTEALFFGTAGHCYILEGEKDFDSRYVLMQKYNGDKRSGEYRTIKKTAFDLASAQGKEVITDEDFQAIHGMKQSILSHPTAKLFIGKHEPELVVVWKDKATGLLCKARFDVAPLNETRAIIDLKTTTNASEHGFAREIIKHRYYFSAAHYLIGASEALKEKIDVFAIIAVEKKPPFKCEVHELSADYINEAMILWHNTMRKENECRDKGFWPSYLNAGVIVQEKPFSLISE